MRRTSPLAFLLAFALGACGDSTEPKDTHVGTYQLQSIEGETLPVVLFEILDFRTEAVSGTLRLNSDETWDLTVNTRFTIEGVVTTEPISESGTYTLNGTTLTLTGGPGSVSGSLIGDTLTITDEEGLVWVFVKV